VEHFLHRMAFRPQVVYLTAFMMVVGAARRCAPSPDAPGTQRAITSTISRGTVWWSSGKNTRKRVHVSCDGTVSYQSSLESQLSNIASSVP
jgi:hypothetical protein